MPNAFDVAELVTLNGIAMQRERQNRRRVGIHLKQNDEKKAIVTLEDGHSIDVTTGL